MSSRRPPFAETLRQEARALIRPAVRRARGEIRALAEAVRGPREGAPPPPLREQWERVLRAGGEDFRRLATEPPPAGGERVLIATAHGFGGARLAFETIVALALRMRGAAPTVLYCDATLPACEFNRHGNFDPDPGPDAPVVAPGARLEPCRVCTADILDPYELLPLERVPFRRYLREGDLARAEAFADAIPYAEYGGATRDGIRVGEHAFASLMRATLRGTPADDEPTRRLFRRYLISTSLLAELASRAMDDLRPDVVVAVHGVYATHGTICEVARAKGARVVVYGTPYRRGTIWLSHDDTYHRTLVSEPNSVWENMEWTPERERRVDEYLGEKRFGGRDYAAYHDGAIDDRAEIARELDLDPAKPVVALYTNVLWDAQLYYSYNAFDNMLDWMFETIRWFEKRPDLQLVVRVHPAEAKGAMPTAQPMMAEIEREFPTLPANVRVVRPETPLSSYTLAELSRAALIYGARMGVEVAAMGVPLVVAGETFNRRKGYSIDVETREEYFRVLEGVAEMPRLSPEIVERAKKYAYHYYFRLMMEFPLFSVADGIHLSSPRIEIASPDDLAPGRCAALDAICDGIRDGKTPFFLDPLETAAEDRGGS